MHATEKDNVDIYQIPHDLRSQALWCCWKFEERDGKRTKVPYNPRTGGRAMSSEKETFSSFKQAIKAYNTGNYDGLGIGVFDDICGIDIDHCISENGEISETALSILRTMDTYTEYSPSRTGLHMYFKASGLDYDKEKYYIKNPHNGVELYLAGTTRRFLTVTGHAILPCGPQERGATVQKLLDTYMRKPTRTAVIRPTRHVVDLSDAGLVEEILASRRGPTFSALLHGDTSLYNGDDSRADLAFCFILALYTNDKNQIDRIFRNSGLFRKKWDRPTGGTTYGEMTIDKAFSFVTQRPPPMKQKLTEYRQKSLTNQITSAQERCSSAKTGSYSTLTKRSVSRQ